VTTVRMRVVPAAGPAENAYPAAIPLTLKWIKVEGPAQRG
jgi:hypothetical protein